jgi:hypothetical protein
MLTVHVRVTDAGTGKPTPVRLRLTDSRGTYFAPFGRLATFATTPGTEVGGSVQLGEESFAYIDGACEVRLPAGPLHVEIHKGPEYTPVRRQVVLGAGQISLRLAVERWADWRSQGWYSGDSRAHDLTPHAALLEGQAEDLAVANLLARQHPAREGRPAAFTNLLAFSGSRPALEAPGCQVIVNTWNRHPFLGTVSLLNCHRPVYPLRFGGPDGLDDWSVSDWCDQCHRKRGLVVWSDGDRLSEHEPQGEALAAVLLGNVDAFEVTSFPTPEPPSLALWYRLLDCGLPLPLAGGSGKDSNAALLGGIRTYARLEPNQALDYPGWIEAVRAGRTFITNGPLLSLTVEEQKPGAVLDIGASGRTVRLRAEAQSAVAFDRVELLHNGEVVASRETSGDRLTASVEAERHVTASGWLAARCWGQVFAHTSPVYLRAEGQAVRAPADVVTPLRAALERTLAWVRAEARCPAESQREQLVQTLVDGLHRLDRCREG